MTGCTVVDYGMGNVGSILNMLKRVGVPARVSSEAAEIAAAERLILPGVGAFDTGMQHLHESGLIDVLNHKVLEERVPTLGICLGMQLLMRTSQEGRHPGLGWIAGVTVGFPDEGLGDLKVPHMGWNTVQVCRNDSLFQGLEQAARFYFVHSYYVVCDRDEDVLAWTTHGVRFASSVQQNNIVGTQFHPEKSHRFGMQLLKNFIDTV
ncbi:MAG: imidazole glycerol phosphate synthase subunit HisH [Acidimicrobiia bacterium]